MTRIAACDDDSAFVKKFCNLLRSMLERRGFEAEVQEYFKGDLLLSHHKMKHFNVVFLDIDMPQTGGFEIAKAIAEETPECCIIFVTNHNELVYDSFMFRPLNFITKDTADSMRTRLEKVIDQLIEHTKQNKIIVLESPDNGRLSVAIRDILYIESSNHHVLYTIKGESKPIKIRDKINELEQKFSEYHFVRIHKKYLVNLRHVFNINRTREVVRLKNGLELPMSRNYKEYVSEQLTKYLRRSE